MYGSTYSRIEDLIVLANEQLSVSLACHELCMYKYNEIQNSYIYTYMMTYEVAF